MPTENQNAEPATSLAAGHDLNQWRIVPVEPTETMVINGFESEPDECFSDEEVWEQYQGMSGCQQAAFRAKLCWAAMLAAAPAAPQAELNRTLAERDSNPKPDPALCKFYDVADWPGLVRELVGHVAQLQDSAKRNVKPWEDTFPPTLLPAYIERVNTANSAAQPQGEPVAWIKPDVLATLRKDECCYAFGEQSPKGNLVPLYAVQPAPVSVVLPERAVKDGAAFSS